MKFKVIIHEAEEGGYWAEVPALPGCFSQAESLPEMHANIREAIECHLDVGAPEILPVCRVRQAPAPRHQALAGSWCGGAGA